MHSFEEHQLNAVRRMSRAYEKGAGVRLSSDEVRCLCDNILCNLISDLFAEEE